jgi:hypothetical protein
VSYAHKRFKQIKSTGLLEDSGDYLHISPEELRRGLLLGDRYESKGAMVAEV